MPSGANRTPSPPWRSATTTRIIAAPPDAYADVTAGGKSAAEVVDHRDVRARTSAPTPARAARRVDAGGPPPGIPTMSAMPASDSTSAIARRPRDALRSAQRRDHRHPRRIRVEEEGRASPPGCSAAPTGSRRRSPPGHRPRARAAAPGAPAGCRTCRQPAAHDHQQHRRDQVAPRQHVHQPRAAAGGERGEDRDRAEAAGTEQHERRRAGDVRRSRARDGGWRRWSCLSAAAGAARR